MGTIFKTFSLLVSFTCLVICACQKNDTDTFLIAATNSKDAVDAGMKILEEGGSAMDAALSVALSEIAATGGKYISYAGVLNLMYYEAETGKIHNLNASFNTVLNETDPLSIPKTDTYVPNERLLNGRTILVPGFMKGVEEAHKRFGKIPFKNIFDHAISVAQSGIIWSNQDANAFNSSKWIVTKYPEGKSIFTKPDGTFYKAGDNFKQPALAKTLKIVSTEGADYMYKGDWAKKFVSAAQSIGSKITLEDLASYDVIISQPVQGTYHGYDIHAHGEPAIGGINLIEALNLAEATNLSSLGHYSKSPLALATLAQISKASAFASYVPEFFDDKIDLSKQSRLKKSTSKALWEFMLSASDSAAITFLNDQISDHSAAIVAIDKWGNMVSLIHSINTLNWGANGLFVDGISIPDAASFQQKRIEKTGPGKRLPDQTNPGIAMKDGQPILAFSCIGRALGNQTLTSLINILDFNLTPDQVVKTPVIGNYEFVNGQLHFEIEQNKYPDSLISAIKELGVNVKPGASAVGGFWSGIYIDHKEGEIVGSGVWQK